MDILLVEDHRDIAENIADFCEARGHELTLAMDGVSALRLLERQRYHVVVLDVMLPRMDGLECLQQLRASGSAIPVLLLTARDTLEDKLAGFAAGADDYLVKPFALPELLVRLEALQRRAHDTDNPRIELGDLVIDIAAHRVHRSGRELNLNRTCFALLALLARNHGRALSRSAIEHALWGESPPDSDALRTHLYHLRQVVDRPFDRPLIETVRGVGIRLAQA